MSRLDRRHERSERDTQVTARRLRVEARDLAGCGKCGGLPAGHPVAVQDPTLGCDCEAYEKATVDRLLSKAEANRNQAFIKGFE